MYYEVFVRGKLELIKIRGCCCMVSLRLIYFTLAYLYVYLNCSLQPVAYSTSTEKKNMHEQCLPYGLTEWSTILKSPAGHLREV